MELISVYAFVQRTHNLHVSVQNPATTPTWWAKLCSKKQKNQDINEAITSNNY